MTTQPQMPWQRGAMPTLDAARNSLLARLSNPETGAWTVEQFEAALRRHLLVAARRRVRVSGRDLGEQLADEAAFEPWLAAAGMRSGVDAAVDDFRAGALTMLRHLAPLVAAQDLALADVSSALLGVELDMAHNQYEDAGTSLSVAQQDLGLELQAVDALVEHLYTFAGNGEDQRAPETT